MSVTHPSNRPDRQMPAEPFVQQPASSPGGRDQQSSSGRDIIELPFKVVSIAYSSWSSYSRHGEQHEARQAEHHRRRSTVMTHLGPPPLVS